MTARGDFILGLLRNNGFSVRANGDRIIVTPARDFTPELRDLVEKHKAEVLQALQRWPAASMPARNFRAEPARHDERARRRPAPSHAITGRRRR